ncbi:AMP-binding protein [Maribacter sp. 2307ULW6-5]|uniref:AMP-binding protein n=1 Tax=Maribacter sp. 2307ULW6-5 TaxID=3386275 RepID=UPI0039BD609A
MIVHPQFRFNGRAYDGPALLNKAHKLVATKVPYEKAIGNFLVQWLNDDATLTTTTSGSTGTPKAIVIPKEKMVNSALATAAHFKLKAGQRALLCLPADYIAGKMMLVRAMVLGLELDAVAPNSQPLEQTVGHYHFAAMVPLQLMHSLNRLEKVGTLIVGGAPLPQDVKWPLAETPTKIYETYGMTETVTHVAVRQVFPVTSPGHPLEERPFLALPGVRFEQDGRACLVVQAPGLSAEKVVTNDVVNLLSDRSFFWLGRYDNVVNSGGVKLFPEQIEKVLQGHVAQPFFLVGVPDGTLGEKLVLFVKGEGDAPRLRSALETKTTLEKYQIPREVVFLNTFEETPNGKVDRKKTLASYLAGR